MAAEAFSYGYGGAAATGAWLFLWIIESGLSCMAICSGEPPAMEEREQLSCGASPDSLMDYLMAGLPLA